MVVTRTEVPEEEEIDDEDFSLSDTDKPSQHVYRIKRTAVIDEPLLGYKYLLEHGLSGSVRSPRILRGELLNYIKSTIAKLPSDSDFEELSDTDTLFEGAKKTVVVNQYERNQEARKMCIAANGYKCKVCGMDFEKTYGEIGRGFIHVHHIVPISTIGEEYQLDPVKDLVPVCPNCHAMLHRGIDGKVLTVDELKKLISNKDKI
jgi:5-methylcytosine-specific restriction protein A